MTKKELIVEAIKSLGYEPQLDEENDIFIRYQMKTIFFLTAQDDEPYVGVLLPQLAEIPAGEESIDLAACNKITREVKFTKVYIDHTFKSVSANCEFFYTDLESLKNNIQHALEFLGVIRSVYFSTRAELSDMD